MTNVMIVMMLWMGSSHGGPATIQGFETMRACESAAQIVLDRQPSPNARSWIKHVCMELPVR